MYKIVVARLSHLDEIVKLCLKSLQQGHERSFPFCKFKIKNLVYSLINDNHQLVLVAVVEGRVKGLVIGQVASHAYAEGLVAEDLALYVSPFLRGTQCYQELATSYEKWCSRIPNLLASSLSLSQLNATTQVMASSYSKLGYKRAAVTYLNVRGDNE